MYGMTAFRLPIRPATRVLLVPKQGRRAITIPPPSGSSKKDTTAIIGGNTALLVGGVTLLVAIGYYMTSRKEKTPATVAENIKRDVRDARDVAQAKTEEVGRKAESLGRDAKYTTEEEARRAQYSGESLLDKTKHAAHDAKVTAEESIAHARDAITTAAGDTKRETEREAEKAKEATSSWFSLGKSRAEETKADAAKRVASEAESVRVAADKRA